MAKNIAILASGNGSNAENIFNFFKTSSSINVVLICCNNKDAYVVKRAKNLNVPMFVFTKKEDKNFYNLKNILKKHNVDFIALAGFLLKIPENILLNYSDKIINIHPALLPKYGGKGMYGKHVHQAVKENHETETGITIHYVNEAYDEGEVIFQAKVTIENEDSIEIIASKVHELEQANFPKVIQNLLNKDYS